jgi:LmbE family N-acetylglucosaminyl deacetylase
MTRLLAVVAHPDDETFGLGSVLALASEQGAEVAVWCATRGEAGEPAPGCGIAAGGELAAAREAELRAAAGLLGVTRVTLGGFLDSGMTGPAPAGSLAAAGPGEVLVALRREVARVRPDVVVTLDGSDGHRDHIAVRDAAVDAAADVPWVYLHCLPRSLMRAWVEHALREEPHRDHLRAELADLGTPDESITTVLDTRRHLGLRWRAIREHRSQVSPFDTLPAPLQDAFLTFDHLRRVLPAWTGGRVERVLEPLAEEQVDPHGLLTS